MMSAVALAAMTRMGPASLSQLSVLNNRNNWLYPVQSCTYAKSAEAILGLDKPKKPLTAFLQFSLQIRPALKTKNPTAGPVEIIKIASKHWEQLGADVKQKLTAEYHEKMEQYRTDLANFEASLTEKQLLELKELKQELIEKKEKRKVKAEYKELGRPKRPMSSYFLYCQKFNEDLVKLGLKEFHKLMKQKWADLPDTDKKVFDAKAIELMDVYRKEMLEWEQKMIAGGHTDLIRSRKLPAKLPKKEEST